MKRLLLYVHFNKYNRVSSHVYYQLTQMRPLFSKVVFISNSQVSEHDYQKLVDLHLMDNFIQRENVGFDFAAWRDGMTHVGFDDITTYDVVTIMTIVTIVITTASWQRTRCCVCMWINREGYGPELREERSEEHTSELQSH